MFTFSFSEYVVFSLNLWTMRMRTKTLPLLANSWLEFDWRVGNLANNSSNQKM